jgi:hypothetical protein
LEDGRELIAINPEEEEREGRDDAGQRETARIEKDVVKHDVHDHRAEQGESEWDETRPDEQKQTADNFEPCNDVNVAAVRSEDAAPGGVTSSTFRPGNCVQVW